MNRNITLAFLALLLFSCTGVKEKKEQEAVKPNIIYILADDLGYGDLSCYGQEKFETPNIDKLAARGVKFTQHYCGSAVCAPSRSTLLTGEHTGHTPIRGNKEMKSEGQVPIPASTLTLAEVMKNAGYTTGMFGKWGLGYTKTEGDPNNQGFDEFYGYNCQRMAHRYYPPYLWHNQEKLTLEGNDWTNTVTYAPDKIQEATLQFIEKNKDKPFFAYVPFVLPHAELISPKDSISEMFEGKFVEDNAYLASDSYASDYGPDIITKRYCSQAAPYATFAAMITRMDVYVGQIAAKLEKLGIADNTIVMFASDNGPHEEGGANPAFFNSGGGLRGVKRDLYEGGVRTPFIVVWPEVVKAGSSSNHVSAFWDVLPTCADIVNENVTSQIDGISFLPELLGKGEQKKHEYLYWELNVKGGRKAIRMGDWKGVVYDLTKKVKGEFELYNLAEDPTESNNIAINHPDVVDMLKKKMKESRSESENFPFAEMI